MLQKTGVETQSGARALRLSVIIPAHNEADYIAACLKSLLEQNSEAGAVEVIVVSNGCTDATAEIAHLHEAAFRARDWVLKVLELPQGSKPEALNAGDDEAGGMMRMYLDADIQCDPALLGQLRADLSRTEPTYATGKLKLMPSKSVVTRLYGEFWQELPFMQSGAVGAGCYAVNASGRARWGKFPQIVADDSFARLQFAPAERMEVPAPYLWPLAEGFGPLVRVRRRQDAGMRELFRSFPELEKNEAKPPVTFAKLRKALWQKPLPCLIYVLVAVMSRSRPPSTKWARGR